MTKGIRDKIVVVTGAGSGLGEATADSFARAVALAMSQPAEVDINEILDRPSRQDL
jgi:NADP-dependent 3-hydroxy acid dehydrogenase YdfG